tara:strand:- start:134 stop:334 length:201 start_codon:yes stop_codon:yes gene_type:complete
MILTKMVINAVATKLTKHFKLDKIMAYVFEDNELDDEVKSLENRITILEAVVSCKNCKKDKGDKNG